MTDFGDIERADTWDADPTIAAEQVAYRLHKLRVAVQFLAGGFLERWQDMDDTEQEHALDVGSAIVRHIAAREPDNPAVLAEIVHTARVTREGGAAWDDLSGDERQIAIDLLDLIIDWLDKEGPR